MVPDTFSKPEGYKPRANYQSLLGRAVERYLDEHADFFENLKTVPRLAPTTLPLLSTLPSLNRLFEQPPDHMIVPRPAAEPWQSKRGQRIDFAKRDAENRQLGRLGEEFVVSIERRRLSELGRDDLAARVEWVAQTRGDGLGFDVLSYNGQDASERFVEVKTTGLGKFFPFYVTSNEVNCSMAVAEKYHLYRVFDFSSLPRLYTLDGPLSSVLNLEPVQFRATF